MKKPIEKISLSAMFIALGLVLPLLTGQLQVIGNMLCPMHIPVLLCGFICGWPYGLAVGFILPLLRSLIFTMPPMFPVAIAMAFELAAYGFVSGIMYSKIKRQNIGSVYICLVTAMILGRLVWGAAEMALLGVGTNGFTLTAFITNGFVNAVPGIILQLILIPAVLVALDKTHLVPFKKVQK